MFPQEDYLYKTASKVGFIIGVTQILLSGFVLRGYLNASQKIAGVYDEFGTSIGSGFTWGYISTATLLALGVFTLLLSFLLKKSKPELMGRYYKFLAPLLFLDIVTAFLCVYVFQKLAVSAVIGLPDNL